MMNAVKRRNKSKTSNCHKQTLTMGMVILKRFVSLDSLAKTLY